MTTFAVHKMPTTGCPCGARTDFVATAAPDFATQTQTLRCTNCGGEGMVAFAPNDVNASDSRERITER